MNDKPFFANQDAARSAGVEGRARDRDHSATMPEILGVANEVIRAQPRVSAEFEDYEQNCHTAFHAAHYSGTRPLKVIDWIVMHDTEGGTAFTIAAYFSQPASRGSAHVVVDDLTCYRTLNNNEIPWGAPGANYKGFHIEECGYAKWTVTQWKARIRTLRRAAWKAAFHCRLFGIPPYFVWADELKVGKKGVTTHAEVTKAFGGTHTDPGKGWPRFFFMGLVRYYYARLKSTKPIA